MKPLAAIATATLVLAFVTSAPAQRGGAARGGSSVRSAPSGHSGFVPSAHSFSGPAYRYSGPAFAPGPRITSTSRIFVAPAAVRPTFYSLRRSPIPDRRRYAPDIRVRAPYVYPGLYANYGWIDPAYYDNSSYDIASVQSVYPDPNFNQQQPEPEPPPPSVQNYAPPPQPAPAEAEAVTLIFKDGRPSEQIHNYALTRTMLYVRDQHHRDIPVDQLDLAATQKANQPNGVEFVLPTGN